VGTTLRQPRVGFRTPQLRIALLLVVLGAIGAGGFTWFQTHAASTSAIARPGSPAPDIKLPLLDGGTGDLAQQRGKVVLVNFWATWCIPCRTEMPELQRLADGMQGERFMLFTVICRKTLRRSIRFGGSLDFGCRSCWTRMAR